MSEWLADPIYVNGGGVAGAAIVVSEGDMIPRIFINYGIGGIPVTIRAAELVLKGDAKLIA